MKADKLVKLKKDFRKSIEKSIKSNLERISKLLIPGDEFTGKLALLSPVAYMEGIDIIGIHTNGETIELGDAINEGSWERLNYFNDDDLIALLKELENIKTLDQITLYL